jgi:S-adenosylmethionine synthetase
MRKREYTAEFVSHGHPDKLCDQISDAILDALLDIAADQGIAPDRCRAAVEVLGKGNLVVVSGEVSAPRSVLAQLDVTAVVEAAWIRAGYAHQGTPVVINHIQPQSQEIASLVDGEGLAAGAGDQGIMAGYAHRATPSLMPPEYAQARALLVALAARHADGTLPWLRSDAKSQVTLGADGEVLAVILSTQHDETVSLDALRDGVFAHVVRPTLGDVPRERVMLNYKGSFVLGGTAADCGVTGRKIVVDQYGPRTPVGGGAFSGKDPSKVDRSAAYMARLIARDLLLRGFADAQEASVQIAFGIGQVQPASVTAMLDGGRDATEWVRDTYPDLSPRAIQARLGLWERQGWRYGDTAAGGHFGRSLFPWEQDVKA